MHVHRGNIANLASRGSYEGRRIKIGALHAATLAPEALQAAEERVMNVELELVRDAMISAEDRGREQREAAID